MGGKGGRVNAISPGRFLTPLTEAEMSDPDKYARFVTQVPLGRIGDPEEIVWPALWLASDASSFVTGANAGPPRKNAFGSEPKAFSKRKPDRCCISGPA